jgi:hypothetical protein
MVVLKTSAFRWNKRREEAALWLAQGYTQQETAAHIDISERTIRRWYEHVEFSTEVDRLSLMVGIASRAERLRLAMKVIRQKVAKEGAIQTEKDLLDWIKFAQSETDGAKLDLAAVLEAMEGAEGPGAQSGA